MAEALAGKVVVCPRCNREIQLRADPSVQKSLDDVDLAMTDLRRSIDQFGR